jgi:leader peptidase (prepilin peptidase)/N-methyltransferase
VPVLSWLLLRARCRACGTRISIRYPFVELCVGHLTCGLALRHGFSWTFAELLVFAATLVVVAFIDLDTWEIPLVFPTVLAVTGLSMGGMGDFGGHPWRMPHWLQLALPDQGSGLLERAVGLSAGFLSLACINVVATYVARRRGMIDPGEFAMGWGDPLLIAGMGAVLGWHALPWLIFLASFQGAVVGLALRLAGKMPAERETTKGEAGDESWVPPPSALPFGPFLALAGLEVALFGQSLASWSSVFLHISG